MVVESCFERLRPVERLAVPGDRNEKEVRAGCRLPYPASNLVPGEPGKADIDEGDVGLRGEDQLQAAGPVARRPDLVAVETQDHLQGLSRIGVILHDRDAAAPRARTLACPPGRALRFSVDA